jgi:hypothetical protein
MDRTSFSISKNAGIFGCLVWSTLSFAYTCPSNGVDVKTLGNDWKDIAGSCEGLMNTMDATQVKKAATDLCCKKAIEYIQKNPEPCSDQGKSRYRIKLGLTVCDQLSDPLFDYEHDFCVNQMLYHIYDPKVLAIADKCSPTGGKAARGGGGGGKGGRGGGGGQPDEPKPSGSPLAGAGGAPADGGGHSHGPGEGHGNWKHGDGAPAVASGVDSNGRKSDSGANGAGLQNPDDLHLDDEAYTKCQRKRLDKYLEDLQADIEKNPGEEAACLKAKQGKS